MTNITFYKEHKKRMIYDLKQEADKKYPNKRKISSLEDSIIDCNKRIRELKKSKIK